MVERNIKITYEFVPKGHKKAEKEIVSMSSKVKDGIMELTTTTKKFITKTKKLGSVTQKMKKVFIESAKTWLPEQLSALNNLKGGFKEFAGVASGIPNKVLAPNEEKFKNITKTIDALEFGRVVKEMNPMIKTSKIMDNAISGLANRYEKYQESIAHPIEATTALGQVLNKNLRPLEDFADTTAGLSKRQKEAAFNFDYALGSLYKLDERIKKTEKNSKKFYDGLGKGIRTIGFVGFVMSITAQRIIRSVRGVIEQFYSWVLGVADTKEATSWLSDTLVALAMSGDLTDEKLSQVVSVFEDWYTTGTDLAGKIADIKVKVNELRDAAATGVVNALDSLETKFGEVDWEGFKEDISSAAETLTTDLINAIVIALGGEGGLSDLDSGLDNSGTTFENFGEKIKTAAGFIGGFAEGVGGATNKIFGFWTSLTMGEKSSEDFGKTVGGITTTLLAFGVPLTLVGSSLWGLKMAFDAIKKVWVVLFGADGTAGILSGITESLGVGGLATALILVAGLLITLWANWEDLKEMWAEKITPALRELNDALGFGPGGLAKAIKGIGKTIMGFLKSDWNPFKIVLESWIDLLSRIIRLIAKLVKAWKNFKEKFKIKPGGAAGMAFSTPPSGEGSKTIPRPPPGFESQIPGAQHGGIIPATGIYMLHRGERVIPAKNTTTSIGTININVHGVSSPEQFADQLGFYLARKIRKPLVIG